MLPVPLGWRCPVYGQDAGVASDRDILFTILFAEEMRCWPWAELIRTTPRPARRVTKLVGCFSLNLLCVHTRILSRP